MIFNTEQVYSLKHLQCDVMAMGQNCIKTTARFFKFKLNPAMFIFKKTLNPNVQCRSIAAAEFGGSVL